MPSKTELTYTGAYKQGKALRQQILASLVNQSNEISANNTLANKDLIHTLIVNTDAWWLLGTVGCHLCDEAQNIVSIYKSVDPIDCITLDIADLDEVLLMQFATTIPVILTPSAYLAYPFSIADLHRL